MALYTIILLAVVQGITEFLPISSSGHLVLIHAASGQEGEWQQSLLMDVAVHVGTLFSVLLYFRKDVLKMLYGLKDCTGGKYNSEGAKLTLYVVISSLPVIAAGFALHVWQPSILRTIEVMAWATLIFGALLYVADQKSPATREIKDLTLKDAIMIGLSQALALIPGTSRSGITMTAARFLGFSRTESAHYSLLLAMVAISGAGMLGSLDLIESRDVALSIEALAAMALAFLSGLIAIHLMMKWLARASFTPFVIYRVILGIVLLIGVYSGWFV